MLAMSWKLCLALYVTLAVVIGAIRMVRRHRDPTLSTNPKLQPWYDRALQELVLQLLIATVFLLVLDLVRDWNAGLWMAMSVGPWLLTAGYSLQVEAKGSPWHGPARTVYWSGVALTLAGLLWAVWSWAL